MSLEQVWTEFGESLETLQTRSKLIPLFKKKSKIEKMKSFEFGASLGRVWREFGESPKSLQTHSSFPKNKK
jgi:hypothetical protein